MSFAVGLIRARAWIYVYYLYTRLTRYLIGVPINAHVKTPIWVTSRRAMDNNSRMREKQPDCGSQTWRILILCRMAYDDLYTTFTNRVLP